MTTTEPAPAHVATNGSANGSANGSLSGDRSVRDLVQSAQRDLSLLVSKEVELAKSELQDAAKKAAVGGAGFGAAGVFVFFALMAGVMCFGYGLAAAGLSLWLAFLIVMLVFLVLAGAVAAIGIVTLKKLKAPTGAIEGAKADIAAVRPHHS